MKLNKAFLNGITIATIVAILDLLSKRMIFAFLEQQETAQIEIFNFFSLVTVWNRGVSFGMFNSLENSHLIFTFIQGAIALILCFWLYRVKDNYLVISLGLIIGGALGNVIDRFQNGAVADFLDFHIGIYHWPAFNLADSCVFIGVVILLFDELIFKKKK